MTSPPDDVRRRRNRMPGNTDHCPRGHPKTPENRSASVSRCLVCARIQDKARYELKKAAAEPVIDVRWQCPHGHFVAFAAIQCEDQRDDFAYHGIRSVCSYDCRACGETHHEMPRAVVVGGAS